MYPVKVTDRGLSRHKIGCTMTDLEKGIAEIIDEVVGRDYWARDKLAHEIASRLVVDEGIIKVKE